jgi:hypothetical protein
MSRILEMVQKLAVEGKVRISEHGYDELAADGLTVREVLAGLVRADPLEEYPDYPKGACVLVLQYGKDRRPIHAVWGIPSGSSEPAVLVTAYRPTPERWSSDYKRRIS